MSTYFLAILLQFFRLLYTIKRIFYASKETLCRNSQTGCTHQKVPRYLSVGLLDKSVELFNGFVKRLKLRFSAGLIGVKPGCEVVLTAVNYMSIGGEEQL